MNKLHIRYIYKLFAFVVLFFLACGFQTSFWPNVITFLPSPQIWLIIILFLAIKWKSLNTIFYIYFLTYCLTFFSEIPLKMIWVTTILTYFLIVSVKNRIQLSGVFSFILFCFMGSLVFETAYYFMSDILEPVPTTFMFLDRLLQVLINFIFSYPVYFVLELVDRAISTEADWRDSSQFSRSEALNE